MRARYLRSLAFILLLTVILLPKTYANLPNTSYAYHTAYPIIKGWFTNMTKRNFSEVDKMLADTFVSLHIDAQTRSKAQELRLIRNLNMRTPSITNFEATRSHNVIIATYQVSVSEYINGKHYSTKPSPRMTVLQRNDKGKWLILAHANLNLPKVSKHSS